MMYLTLFGQQKPMPHQNRVPEKTEEPPQNILYILIHPNLCCKDTNTFKESTSVWNILFKGNIFSPFNKPK